MAAFRASTLVCSVMLEISSVISPISCDDSPRRLMRLAVSWIWSRMRFMPPMLACTACRPDSAAWADWRATSDEVWACTDTCWMRCAMSSTDWPVSRISRNCSVEVASSSMEVFSTAAVVWVTRSALVCTWPTRLRSSSTV